MLRYSLLLFNLLAALTIRAQQSFTLTGKISGHPDGMIRIGYEAAGGKRVSDSSRISNGSFSFHGMLDGPTNAYIYENPRASMDDPNVTDFFVEPGDMTITLKQGAFREAVITGSTTETEYQLLKAAQEPIREEEKPLIKRYDAANAAYRKAVKAKADDRTLDTLKYRAAAIHDAFDPFNDRMAQMDYQFFAAHPQSYVTAYMLQYHTSSLPLDSLQLFYDRLGSVLQQSSPGRHIAEEIAMLKAGSPGSMAADFSKKDLHGQQVTLSAYRGKYVLLDFWASWCVPCRKSMPHVKELYDQYKDKGLAVIAIADDDNNPDAWKKAIAKDGTDSWPNILRGLDWELRRKGEKNPEDLDDKFGIHSLPTKILIDPNGMIIGRYTKGTDEEAAALDAQLAKAFADNTVTIDGSLQGLTAGTWVYCFLNANRDRKDSVRSFGGGFKMMVTVPEGEADQYILQIGPKLQAGAISLVYLDKGTVTVKGPGPLLKDAVVTGGEAVSDYNAFGEYLKNSSQLAGSDSVYKKFRDLYAKKDTLGYTALEPELQRIDSIKTELTKAWILQHPSSRVASMILTFNLGRLDLDKKVAIYDQLTPEAKNNASGKRLEYSIRVNNLTGIGKKALDFTQTDTAGRPVSLRDFHGRYVLLDFWASWCMPCRAENPNVVAAFRKYKDKNFTVLSVSLDRPGAKDAWLDAIHHDGLDWTHVSDLQFWNNAVAKLYDIESIPSNLLLDPNGVIVSKNLHGEELEKKLGEVLP
ncbi:redoxin domain-containing protein [Puia dinghuensis]|uniref:Thioredoxin domain-containing protein n=1 Tax=Puia dinghuensis TaxID=1792502 RepID=A0A8J2UCZ9_9BACT|nr:redoxin domain-containing protein [Puia dinghuensis]GGA97707.1 hypothetical protein GCM10011511_21310 [Puia dinghuensis]